MDKFRLIKERLSILDIFRKYVGAPFRKNNAWWIRSPFSQDKTASCRIREDTWSFQDFSANKWGDGIKLVAYMYNLKNIDAANKIIQDFGLDTGREDFRPDLTWKIKQEQEQFRKEKEKAFFKRKAEHFKILRKLLEGLTPNLEDYTFIAVLTLKTQYENQLNDIISQKGGN